MTNYIILLIGTSGSGKTSIAHELHTLYGLKELESYTDRAKRYESEKGHKFITEDEMQDLLVHHKGDICAYTYFDGHHYCATSKQVDEADIYIIDIKGVEYFKRNYIGNKKPIVIGLSVPENIAIERMSHRGDDEKKIINRVKNDKVAFKTLANEVDFIFDNITEKNFNDIVHTIYTFFFHEGSILDVPRKEKIWQK